MASLAVVCLFAALSSSDAIVTVLNSPSACGVARYTEAEQMVLKAAKDGKPLQQFVIGVTSKDPATSKKYCDLAREKIRYLADKTNNPLAWYLLSLEANDTDFLKRAADGGNVQALNAYGTLIIQAACAREKKLGPKAVEKAFARGYECFRRAAAQKDPNGYINLGTCYLRGLGCEQNLALAHQCFRSAAEAGHPEGMDYVSANFELGHGVKKNASLALAWRMKAKAMRGDKAAEAWLKGEK